MVLSPGPPALAQPLGGAAVHKYVIERDLPGGGKLSASELQVISENEDDIRSHAEAGGFPLNRISRIKTIIDPASADRDVEECERPASYCDVAQL
jgi:hypothetical protein